MGVASRRSAEDLEQEIDALGEAITRRKHELVAFALRLCPACHHERMCESGEAQTLREASAIQTDDMGDTERLRLLGIAPMTS